MNCALRIACGLFAMTVIQPVAVFAEATDAQSACASRETCRKAISSEDVWTGIEGIVTLPTLELSAPDNAIDSGANRGPTVCLRGKAGNQEVECGLEMSAIPGAGNDVSMPTAMAFRPFWRTNSAQSSDADSSFRFYPGDTVRIRMETLSSNRMFMSVELLDPAQRPQLDEEGASAPQADRQIATLAIAPNSPTVVATGLLARSHDAITSLSMAFRADGFGPGQLHEFARVNAAGAFATATPMLEVLRVSSAEWHNVWLLRTNERFAMTSERLTDVRCPDASAVSVEPVGSTAERITLANGN
jgi:hypothetical protein